MSITDFLMEAFVPDIRGKKRTIVVEGTPSIAANLRYGLTLFLLILGGVAGNYLKITLLFNVDFLLGSICTMLVVRWFGLGWGLLSAFLAGSYTYVLWNHPYALIIILGEAAVAGVFYPKRSSNMLFVDAIYWLFIGMPLVWIFYHYVMGMEVLDVLMVMFKQGLNGIFNTLIAVLVASGISAIGTHQMFPREQRLVFRNLVAITLLSFILFPSLAGIIAASRYELARTEQTVSSELTRTTESTRELLGSWLRENGQAVDALAYLAEESGDLTDFHLKYFMRALRTSHPSFLRLGLCDARAVSVLVEPAVDEAGRPGVGRDYSERPYFQELKHTLEPVISNTIISRPDQRTPLVLLATPILMDGELGGYAFAAVNLTQFQTMLKKVAQPLSAEAAILDAGGLVVAGTRPKTVIGRSFDRFPPDTLHEGPYGLMQFIPGVGRNISIMQRWKDSTYVKILDMEYPKGWKLILEIPATQFQETLFTANLGWMGMVTLLVFLTAVLSHALSQRMVRSLKALQETTIDLPSRIAEGSGTAAWPKSAIYEVHELVENFRSISKMLAGMFQELQKADLAKNEFLAVMSHEIRTPMNAILGMTELSLQEELPPEVRDQIETVRDSAHLLLGILNDILDFSKIEAGRIELEDLSFNLHDQLETLVRTMEIQCRKKGIYLRLSISPGVPEAVRGDPLRLGQVLNNLVSNAIKFTETGGVTVKVEIDPATPEAEPMDETIHLVFSVTDTGIGIPPDKQDRVFETFRQVDSTTSRRYGGSGLGLAICHRLVTLMGGRIRLESDEGKGSRFLFTLPFKPGDPDRIESAQPEAHVLPASNRIPADLLLAEDNPTNIKVATLALKRLGYRVTVAQTGLEVIEIIKKARFDLVLMDLEMPGMDGMETTRRLRSGEGGEAAEKVPVIAMTAHALAGFRKQALEAGMNDYVTKPVNFPELDRTIQNLLNAGDTADTTVSQVQVTDQKQTVMTWNPASALDRLGGDHEMFREICDLFITDLKNKVMAMRTAIENKELARISLLAHSLKGSAGTVGADECRLLAECLENAANGRQETEVHRLIEDLADNLEQLIKIFKRIGLASR